MNEEIPEEVLYLIVQHEVGHYVTYRALDIIPKRIDFHYTKNGLIGINILPTDNYFFDDLNDVSRFSFSQCVGLAAGTFAEYIDFDTRTIDHTNASMAFMNDITCRMDREFLQENRTYYIASNFEKFKYDPIGETSTKISMVEIFNKATEILLQNSDTIKKLTDYIFEKIKELKCDISITNEELNNLSFIEETFGNSVPGYFVKTSETLKEKPV